MRTRNRVLFVDDEEGVRISWNRMLSEQGFDVTTAEDGDRAISALRGQPTDVVVADWKMPEKDGLELLEWVKAEQPETRVILITGYGSEAVEQKARALGAFDYLTKPVDPTMLASIVATAASLEADDVEAEEAEVEVESEPVAAKADDEAEPMGAVQVAGRVLAAPFVGLAFVIALPLIGIGAFGWYLFQALRAAVAPADAHA